MEKENEESEQAQTESSVKDNIIEEKVETINQENENKEEKKSDEKPEKDEKETVKKTEKESEEKANKEEKEKFHKAESKDSNEKKKSKKGIIVLVVFIFIFLLFISTIFAILNMNNDKIISGVYIQGFNVSNYNKDEINKIINDKLAKLEEIEIHYDNYEEVIKLQDMGITVDGKDAIKEAIKLGKTNNILVDNFSILKSKIFKTQLNLNIQIDEEKFKEAIKNTQAEMPGAVQQYSYEIKDDVLIITNGKAGKIINEKLLKEAIVENLRMQFNDTVNTIEIPTQDAIPNPINIESIYQEVYKEAKNAYIVDDPFELHKEENGVDFKISIEEAKELLKEEKETYEIPLKITKPKIAVKDLGDKLFKQTLSKYTTIYDSSNTNRASNIALAAKTINGTILLPGETFSYNGVLGNTTKEKGYKPGGAYVGGKIVQTYGGGICQVSSTLYNAALYANLEIVERHNHSYSVTYVPAGRDATVAYGGKNFRFKNSRSYPIKIVANAKNGVISISIVGIKEEKEYEVELTSTVLSTTPCSVVYENTNTLAEGKQKVIQVGHTGQKSIAYKIIKYNGKTISKTVLSKDTYKPMNRIIQVGTKKGNNTPNNQSNNNQNNNNQSNNNQSNNNQNNNIPSNTVETNQPN